MPNDKEYKIGHLVELEWVDAHEMEAGWHDKSQVMKLKPEEMLSCGYIEKETDTYVTICADKNKNTKKKDRGRCQSIPKCWIKRTDYY